MSMESHSQPQVATFIEDAHRIRDALLDGFLRRAAGEALTASATTALAEKTEPPGIYQEMDQLTGQMTAQWRAHEQAMRRTQHVFDAVLLSLEHACDTFKINFAEQSMPAERVYCRVDADRSVGMINLLWHTVSFTTRGNTKPMATARYGKAPMFTGRIVALQGDFLELATDPSIQTFGDMLQNEVASLYVTGDPDAPAILTIRHLGDEEHLLDPTEAAERFLMKTLQMVCSGGYFHEKRPRLNRAVCVAIRLTSQDPEATPPKVKASVQNPLPSLAPSTPPAARQRSSGLMKPVENAEDTRQDPAVRPKTLAEYIGQPVLKERLDIAIQAARQRNDPLDHLLLYGPPGLGKTTLAMVLATEMGAGLQVTSAPALERPRDILGLLMSLQPDHVLFIDEIHRLNKVTEEILYTAMEDFALDQMIGKGAAAKTLRIPLPRFTLVGATTKAGALSGPLRDRFGMVYRLEFYPPETLVAIVTRTAGLLSIPVTDDGAMEIARRARGTPRIANRLLRRVRDFVTVRNTPNTPIDQSVAREALKLFEVDALGLDSTDRLLLRLMARNFSGGPVGIDTLASAMGEDTKTIEDVYEPYLLQAGLINRTPRGRTITATALAHLGLEPPEGFSQQRSLL